MLEILLDVALNHRLQLSDEGRDGAGIRRGELVKALCQVEPGLAGHGRDGIVVSLSGEDELTVGSLAIET